MLISNLKSSRARSSADHDTAWSVHKQLTLQQLLGDSLSLR